MTFRTASPRLAKSAERIEGATRTGFRVDGDDVGAGVGEGGDIGVGRGNHQVYIEGLFGQRAERLDEPRAERDVGHEVAVHDVDVDAVGAGPVDGADFLAQPGKVRR